MGKTDNAIKSIIENLLAFGWKEIGSTPKASVRIPTMKNPVFGGIGGKRATLGGRRRFVLSDTCCRVTIGKMTINFYKVVNGQPKNFVQFKTKNFEEVIKFIPKFMASLDD